MSHLFLTDSEFETALADELSPATVHCLSSGMLVSDVSLSGSTYLAFARQTLPSADQIKAVSINNWADRIIESIFDVLPDHQPWHLHLWPDYGARPCRSKPLRTDSRRTRRAIEKTTQAACAIVE